jgi:lactate dehydrogenase-like 2-hydroxyacid dehydrogenase
MDSKELELMKKSVGLMNTSFDLCIKQAEMMDSMNEKLDKLLAMKGKEA